MRAALGLLLILVPAAAVAKPAKPGPAAGGPPKASACGIQNLPLAVGNSWAYKSGPKGVLVKITDIQPGKDWAGKPVTVISVEETYDTRVIKTSWTCTAAGLSVGLDSFFFSAEPGGGAGMTFTVTAHDQVTLQADAAIIPDANWVETYKVDVARADGGGSGAVHFPAKLELDRHVIVHGTEQIVTSLGQWNATKVTVELRGRGLVETEKAEIPAKQTGGFWVAKNVGIVKLQDNFDKSWDLVESNLVK